MKKLSVIALFLLFMGGWVFLTAGSAPNIDSSGPGYMYPNANMVWDAYGTDSNGSQGVWVPMGQNTSTPNWTNTPTGSPTGTPTNTPTPNSLRVYVMPTFVSTITTSGINYVTLGGIFENHTMIVLGASVATPAPIVYWRSYFPGQGTGSTTNKTTIFNNTVSGATSSLNNPCSIVSYGFDPTVTATPNTAVTFIEVDWRTGAMASINKTQWPGVYICKYRTTPNSPWGNLRIEHHDIWCKVKNWWKYGLFS